MRRWRGLVPALLLVLAACTTASASTAAHPESTPFDPAVSGALYAQEIDRTLAELEPGRKALVVFGANWCHDSRALAGWLSAPEFEPLLRGEFETVFVDIGKPQTGEGRNLDLASRFGIDTVGNTPVLAVVSSDGKLLNTVADAKSWRNAGSRSEEEIAAALRAYAALD